MFFTKCFVFINFKQNNLFANPDLYCVPGIQIRDQGESAYGAGREYHLARDMQDAYDQAVWRDPQLREKLLEAQRTAEEAKRQAAAAPKVAQKIKASNASLSGAPHGTPSTRPVNGQKGAFGEVTDDVRAAIAQLS